MEIRVYKSRRRLELWENGVRVGEYTVGIGRTESGHKQEAGDGRTPEGTYQVCVKNSKSKFKLSLGLNYPNQIDAEMGLARGLISQAEYREICARVESQQGSLWSTRLGGEIYIHGDLESQSWTEGCIRMRNLDMSEVFERSAVGTRVVIFP